MVGFCVRMGGRIRGRGERRPFFRVGPSAPGEMVCVGIETQIGAPLTALKHCLEAAGTSLDKGVMMSVYPVNSGFYNAINRVYATYFCKQPPARSFVPVASWPMEFDLTIECVAVA